MVSGKLRFSEWDMMGWFARHVCYGVPQFFLNHMVDRIPPNLEPNRNSLEKFRINLYGWVQDLYPWPEQVLGLLLAFGVVVSRGWFNHFLQKLISSKTSTVVSFCSLLLLKDPGLSVIAVFYQSLVMVMRNVTKRPLTTLSSKKLKRICPTSKDVVMLWWLAFCLHVGMFILDVSNVGTSMQVCERYRFILGSWWFLKSPFSWRHTQRCLDTGIWLYV